MPDHRIGLARAIEGDRAVGADAVRCETRCWSDVPRRPRENSSRSERQPSGTPDLVGVHDHARDCTPRRLERVLVSKGGTQEEPALLA